MTNNTEATQEASLSDREKSTNPDSKKEKNRTMSNSQEKRRKKGPTANHKALDDRISEKFDELAEGAEETLMTDAEAAAATADDLAQKLGQKVVKLSQEDYDALHQDLEEAKERGLRALAELENYRARTSRIMAEDRKYAAVDLARAVLPIWDNMSRALEAAEKDANLAALIDGLRMMHKQFVDVLKAHHIEKIDAVGQMFDPHIHESIAQLPNAEVAPNTIIAETQPGFRLYDRIIRPAQVVLAAPAPASPTQSES
ncbi:MAG: nucleotide exchange factor GrpE [Planctomycetia bacterium]|nr:nucleotide exchange factor GrpE [Planctomycetia bacterium]